MGLKDGGETKVNVQKFKESVSFMNKSEENLKLFRIWDNNYYNNYQKEKEISYCDEERCFKNEQDFLESEEAEALNYEWNYFSYSSMVDLYSRMGWEIEETFKERKVQYDSETDTLYHNISFGEIHEKIQSIQDDVEFLYAILLLIRNVHENRKLYKEYVRNIYEGIRECNLEDCLKLIDDSKTKKVFIAMSFAENMKGVRKNIEKAVKDSGYAPMLIDVKEHNNQIVPEIYKEIEECSFIVADLTGQRGGVYYEAGYAMAKEKPLILSCKKDKKEKPHFDVAQINTIFWQNEEDLYNRLINRIRTTIGENR